MPTGDKYENLRKAIACIKGALLIHTKEAFPERHNDSIVCLKVLRKEYESSVRSKGEPFNAIVPAE